MMSEKSLLGTIILHDDLIAAMLNLPDIFISKKYSDILTIIKDLYNSGIRITTESIISKDQSLNRSDIQDLYDSAFQKDLFSDKLDDQIKKFTFNKIQEIQSRLTNGYYKTYQEYMTAVENCNINMVDGIKDTYELKEIYVEYLEKVPSDRYSTGFRTIDKIGGVPKAFFIVVGARPSMGKSSLMVQMVSNDMVNKYKIGIISLEEPKLSLIQMLFSNKTLIDSNQIDLKMLSNQDEVKLASFMESTSKYPIYINDNPNLDIDSICRLAKKWKKMYKIDKLYIDYLQLIPCYQSFLKETDKVSYIAKKLANLRKELNINIIALAQLNRNLAAGVEERAPRTSDLKESGQIEQSADLILLLHEEKRPTDTPVKSNLSVIIGKGRKMPKGIIHCIFRKNFSRIEEIDNNYN